MIDIVNKLSSYEGPVVQAILDLTEESEEFLEQLTVALGMSVQEYKLCLRNRDPRVDALYPYRDVIVAVLDKSTTQTKTPPLKLVSPETDDVVPGSIDD